MRSSMFILKSFYRSSWVPLWAAVGLLVIESRRTIPTCVAQRIMCVQIAQ